MYCCPEGACHCRTLNIQYNTSRIRPISCSISVKSASLFMLNYFKVQAIRFCNSPRSCPLYISVVVQTPSWLRVSTFVCRYRMVADGAVWINHKRADSPEQVLVPKIHILSNGLTLLRVGKKNFCIIKWLSLWRCLMEQMNFDGLTGKVGD